MEALLQNKSDTEGLLTIQLSRKDYIDAFEKHLKNYAQHNKIKGFRNNSVAHLTVVKKRYGIPLLKETVLRSGLEAVFNYIKEHRIIVLGNINVDEETFRSIEWHGNKKISLTYRLQMVPAFEVVLDDTIHVTKYKVASVSDEEMDSYKKRVCALYGDKKAAEVVALHDVVVGTIVNIHEHKESIRLPVTPSIADSLPIVGKNRGTKLSIPPEVIDDLNLFLSPSMLTKAKEEGNNLVLTINKLVRVIPAPLDQKLFDSVFGANTVNSLEAFEKTIREHLIKEAQKKADHVFDEHIRDKLLDHTSIVLPEEYNANAKMVSWEVIVSKLVNKYGIQAKENDVVQELIAQYRTSHIYTDVSDMQTKIMAQINTALKDPQQKEYRNAEQRVFEKKLMEIIKDKITIDEKPIDAKKVAKLEKQLCAHQAALSP